MYRATDTRLKRAVASRTRHRAGDLGQLKGLVTVMKCVVLLFSLVVLATGPVASVSAQAPELETVLSRAGAYVERYERLLGTVIAREIYTQNARVPDRLGRSGGRGAPVPSFPTQRRRMLSDFLMLRLQSQGDQWMGFRAVVEVDGRPVRDRLEGLQDTLEGSVETAVARWRTLTEQSARYNIGGFLRSTNVPTFALTILRAEHRHRFAFEHVDDESVEGLNVWVIQYRERVTPTLISDLRGDDVFARGRIWIDPMDGRLVLTEVLTDDDDRSMRSQTTVRYRPDGELSIWVPYEMQERFESGDGRRLEATASYSNFQQFNVSVGTAASPEPLPK